MKFEVPLILGSPTKLTVGADSEGLPSGWSLHVYGLGGSHETQGEPLIPLVPAKKQQISTNGNADVSQCRFMIGESCTRKNLSCEIEWVHSIH